MPNLFRYFVVSYALVKLGILAGFLISLNFASSTHAAGDTLNSCNGKNLITQLEITDPIKLHELINQAAQTPNAQSKLWKLPNPVNAIPGFMAPCI